MGEPMPASAVPNMLLWPDPYNGILTDDFLPRMPREVVMKMLRSANQHMQLFPSPAELELCSDKLNVMELLHGAMHRGYIVDEDLLSKIRILPSVYLMYHPHEDRQLAALKQVGYCASFFISVLCMCFVAYNILAAFGRPLLRWNPMYYMIPSGGD